VRAACVVTTWQTPVVALLLATEGEIRCRFVSRRWTCVEGAKRGDEGGGPL
jgi:hypothetical protein